LVIFLTSLVKRPVLINKKKYQDYLKLRSYEVFSRRNLLLRVMEMNDIRLEGNWTKYGLSVCCFLH
jgi:hypothetical protein